MMKSGSSEKYLTIKDLRQWLDDNEKEWTDEDVKYLGEFDKQLILSWTQGRGYAPVVARSEWGYGGPLIVALDAQGEEML